MSACTLIAALPSCSEGGVIGTAPSRENGGASSLGPAEEADGSAAEGGASVGLCPSNECPEGRVTCPNNPFPCAVDLSSDDENCGVCGIRCPTDANFTARFHGTMRCIDGACQLVCRGSHANCNGKVEDGCETPILGTGGYDFENCGGCGLFCEKICRDGYCGCPAGQTYCEYDRRCHRLDFQNSDCGECGNVCPPDTEPPLPAALLANRTCRGGVCNKLGCIPPYGDCNDDLLKQGGDGCETNMNSDADNCGSCGNACAPGEECVFGVCRCPCGAPCFTGINTDPYNCGACGFKCPGSFRSIEPVGAIAGESETDPAHGRPICEHGMCGFACSPNWADCDADIENGCETFLLEDPLNCGGCGVRCDGIEGHACVDGHCLMKNCEVQ